MKTSRFVNRIVQTIVVVATLSLTSCASLQLHINKTGGVPSEEVWFEQDSYSTNSIAKLVKKEGVDYKILLLADIQINRANRKGRTDALELIEKLVKSTNPDFIITLGDNTQGYYTDEMTKLLIEHMEQFDIPWAVVLGNHDSEGRKDRSWHGNQYEAAKYSLFQYGPSNIHGVGNYTVLLKNESGDIIYSFIMMDSNEYRKYKDGGGYDFIYHDQISWYKWQVEGVSKEQYGEYNPQEAKVVPSMCFFHIPLMEYADASEAVKNGIIDSVNIVGENNEGIASAKLNSGLFDVMKSLKSTSHVFVGHDHVNNLSVDWQGIKLSYGLKTGKTSYYRDEMQGGTLVTIKTGEANKPAKVEIDYIFIGE